MKLLTKLSLTFITLATHQLLGQSISNKEEYKIIGSIDGLPSGTKVYLTTQEKDTLQSTISNGEKFELSGKLHPDGRFLFIKFDTTKNRAVSRAIFVSNKNNIQVHGKINIRDIEIVGSEEQKQYESLLQFEKAYNKKYEDAVNNVLGEIVKMEEAKNVGDSLMTKQLLITVNEATNYRDSIIKDRQKRDEEWVLAHRNSKFAPYFILNALANNLPLSEHLYRQLPSEVQNSYYGIQLDESIDFKKKSSNISSGKIIPNIQIINKEGKSILLHETFGSNKLTLIDCWASWCGPCRKEIPNLKKVYSKFKDKGFSIIGISSDKNKVKWLEAISTDKTTWPHYIEDKNSNFSKLFQMVSIPAYILIDQDGKLLAFDCNMSSINSFGGRLRGDELIKTIQKFLN